MILLVRGPVRRCLAARLGSLPLRLHPLPQLLLPLLTALLPVSNMASILDVKCIGATIFGSVFSAEEFIILQSIAHCTYLSAVSKSGELRLMGRGKCTGSVSVNQGFTGLMQVELPFQWSCCLSSCFSFTGNLGTGTLAV